MPDNLTYALLRRHLVAGELAPGRDITVSVDQILIEDATGTMAGMQFEMLGAERAAVPLSVLYVDHNVLQIDDKNMQDHRYLRTFAERYGVRFSPPGHGISHYIHLERFGRPGEVLVGADSHSTMSGALGMDAQQWSTARVGQHWRIAGVAAALAGDADRLTAEVDGVGALELLLDVSPSEREVLRAGGLLAQIRNRDRRRVVTLPSISR